MTVTHIDSRTYVGVAADTKPTTSVSIGSRFIERDTGLTFIYDGSAWGALRGDQAGGTLVAGTKSLTTTAGLALSAGQACSSVVVQNDPDNVVDVLIGDSASQVFQLLPGDSIELAVSNVSQVYGKNVSSTTQSVNWLAIT